MFRTGENYTDDGSEVSEATYRPQVVHLGQYVSNGSVGFTSVRGDCSLIDTDFKPISYSGAINVTNNGLFGSTGPSQTYTVVRFALHRAAVERAAQRWVRSGILRKTAVSADPRKQIVRSALACPTHAQSQYL